MNLVARWLIASIVLEIATGTSQTDHETYMNAFQTGQNASLLWGTYRPNLYFGMKTKTSEQSPFMTGLMWFSLADYEGLQNVRHSCEQSDGLKYNWLYHDGREFGHQLVEDDQLGVKLDIELIKDASNSAHGGDWTSRVKSKFLGERKAISFIQYFGGLEGDCTLAVKKLDAASVQITGRNEALGDFIIMVSIEPQKEEDPLRQVIANALPLPFQNLWRMKDLIVGTFTNSVRQFIANRKSEDEQPPLPHEMFVLQDQAEDKNEASTVILQFVTSTDAVIKTVFLSRNGPSADEDVKQVVSTKLKKFDDKMKSFKASFDQKFEQVFPLKSFGYDGKYLQFAKTCISNVFGGIGVFQGDSIVDKTVSVEFKAEPTGIDEDDELEQLLFESPKDVEVEDDEDGEYEKKKGNPEKIGSQTLYTATPSRSFFPRGFLWDEGFHQMMIYPLDISLTMETLNSWLSLMDDNGWIAREQVLGEEARSKVPEEFQIQYPHYANPPTLILPVISMLKVFNDHKPSNIITEQWQKFQNAFVMQTGLNFDTEVFDFDKHARDERASQSFLNNIYPALKKNFEWYRQTQAGKTLDGGQGVYRWRGRTATHCLTSGIDDYPRGKMSVYELHVDLTSWMAMYADMLRNIAQFTGNQKDINHFASLYDEMKLAVNKYFWDDKKQAFGDVELVDNFDSTKGTQVFVRRGYISLFPFLFNLVDVDSPRLKAIMDMLQDGDQLWSDYGIRSLSASDELFGQGENYWRGPIWINVNYMILRALKLYYVDTPGKYQEQAKTLYTNLKRNIVKNVYENYQSTGHLWEQYDANDGHGQRSHPFTGWSALVVNIMAELY